MVSHDWLLFLRKEIFNASHLDCARKAQIQSQITVKLHRVFLSRYKKSASSQICLFHRDSLRDSAQIVTPFVQAGTYPARNFATLGPSSLRPPFTGTSVASSHQLLSPSGTGQATAPIHHLTILRRPVFLVNSRLGLFTATSSVEEALLIPKLRSHFAEFLREKYLEPLSISYLPTCASFGYRFSYVKNDSSFSWKNKIC